MWRVALVLVLLTIRMAGANGPVRPPMPPQDCDAKYLEEKGDDRFQKGMLALAFSLYEKAVQCKVTEPLLFKAGITACKLYKITQNETYVKKAKAFWKRLPTDKQQQLVQACAPTCKLE